jgi:hypothetical protein
VRTPVELKGKISEPFLEQLAAVSKAFPRKSGANG